jgi:protein-L-isoaspartate(D-aspartate) O-methyltransferase
MGALADARREMIEHDLVARGIHDRAVLRAMAEVPREAFVGHADRRSAYADRPLAIGDGQTISQPYIVALMAQELELRPTDRVLDVGTGSGYAAAVLASIADEVWSIERHESLATAARQRLAALGFDRVHVITGDGSRGWPDASPYDAICVAAAASRTPGALLDQLAEGGRLVIPIGSASSEQTLMRIERHGDAIRQGSVIPVRFVPLVAETTAGTHENRTSP